MFIALSQNRIINLSEVSELIFVRTSLLAASGSFSSETFGGAETFDAIDGEAEALLRAAQQCTSFIQIAEFRYLNLDVILHATIDKEFIYGKFTSGKSFSFSGPAASRLALYLRDWVCLHSDEDGALAVPDASDYHTA